MRYLKSLKFWFTSLVILYSFIGFIALPWFITSKLPTLLEQKVGLHVNIDKTSFNPFSFELSLKNLTLFDLAKKPAVQLGEVYLNYSLLALLEKTILIQSFEISQPIVYATLLKDGTLNFENIMPKKQTEEKKDTTTESDISLPKILLQKFILNQGNLRFKDEIKNFTLNLGPYDFSAHDLSSQVGSITSHNFLSDIQSGGKVTLEGGVSLQPLQLYGKIKIDELQLPSLYNYVIPSMPARLAHGKISLTLPYQIDLKDAFDLKITDAFINFKALNFVYEDAQIIDISNIDIKGIDVSYPAQNIAIKSLHVSRPTITAILDKEKKINFQDAFLLPSEEASNKQQTNQETKPWQYSLANAFVEDLKVKFFDNSLEKSAYIEIGDTNFEATSISSDKKISIPYDLKAKINNKTTLNINGDVLQEPLLISSNVDLKSLHVKDFENYILPHVNLFIEDAKIDVDAELKADLSKTPHVQALANAYINDLAINSMENTPLLQWKQLAVQKIDFDQNPMSLSVGSINLEKPFVKLKIAQDGTTNFSNITKKSDNIQELKPVDKEEKKSDMKLKIGPMSIINANADFSDLSLPFPFRTLIHDLNGGLSELDFQKSTPSDIKIDGKIDEYGYANIKGSLIPLEIKKYANIDVIFKNIALNSLTPYSGKFVGQKIESGKLSMDLKYAIDKASLKGSNKLNIDTLTLGEKVESPEAVNLPLGLAIALLQDSNGQIDIDLPVAGDMNNPEFSYGSIVWKAVGNLITGIVTAPFRFLGNMLGIDGEKLKSIDFALGKSEIINTEHEKLQNLEKVLGKRPGIKLAIKGSYDEILDTKSLQQQAFKVLVEATHKTIKEKIKDEKADTYALALKELYLQSNEPKKYEELQKTFIDSKSEKVDIVAFNKHLENDLIGKITITKEALMSLGEQRAQNVKNELVTQYKIDAKRIEILPSENSAAARDEWIEVKLDIKS